ncbi:GHMP family kinase ATP-binding protein [Loigolactobacillus jiayinensis]|uniref:Propanediol utilization protein n=1 Tax=Loigolactobacillus jiayinensis TaxID=2486016 RepID=A0ABW1RFE5_9LACO|nr:propanediol utilization protein [Loigolactobacillus jiayinensis]
MNLRSISASCPATCGELLQGWLAGSEKLVAYGIDLASQVTAELVPTWPVIPVTQQKMYQLCRLLLGYLQQPHAKIRLTRSSKIPIGKGMASSTADLVATCRAVARLFECTLTAAEITALCVQVEASDASAYLAQGLTVIDAHTGQVYWQTDWRPLFASLILEPAPQLSTALVHQQLSVLQLQRQADVFAQTYQVFVQAVQTHSLSLLGQAATRSAQLRQQILPKPYFAEIQQFAQTQPFFGLNVAHSGTVIGLLFDPQRVVAKVLLQQLRQQPFSRYYRSYIQVTQFN